MAILEEQTRLREDALVDERLRAEQAMSLLNAQFEERREDLSRDLRVAEERVAELEALSGTSWALRGGAETVPSLVRVRIWSAL